MEFPERHGHWPLVSAGAAIPATALAWSRREELAEDDAWLYWLPFVALLWHQTEEWVKPGGFLPWFNREVMDSGDDEFPITRRDGLVINVGMGWALALTAGLSRSPGVAACQLVMDLGNAGLHVSQAARRREYNPGSATAASMFLPVGVAGMRALLRRPGRRREVGGGALVGAAASAGLMLVMRRRVARAQPPG